jgi:hypothetical protein
MRPALQRLVLLLSLLPLAVGTLGLLTGAPAVAVMAVTAIELLVPTLIPWQARVARLHEHDSEELGHG